MMMTMIIIICMIMKMITTLIRIAIVIMIRKYASDSDYAQPTWTEWRRALALTQKPKGSGPPPS